MGKHFIFVLPLPDDELSDDGKNLSAESGGRSPGPRKSHWGLVIHCYFDENKVSGTLRIRHGERSAVKSTKHFRPRARMNVNGELSQGLMY